MHERSASRSIGEKIGNFNNFRRAAYVGNAQIRRCLYARCSTPLQGNRIDEADLVVAVERLLSGCLRTKPVSDFLV
jgi:hypothetical protein